MPQSLIHQTLIRRSISLPILPCLRCTTSIRQTLEVIHNCDPHNCPVHPIIVAIYMEIDGDIDGLSCIHPLSLCAVLTKHMVASSIFLSFQLIKVFLELLKLKRSTYMECLENKGKLVDELKRADAVVLTYACDEPSTLDLLSTFWLPKLRRLEVKVPVIVAGCKLDLRDEQQAVSLELVMSPIMQQFREIETCIECSAYKHIQVIYFFSGS
ncbi:putative P-loop containing nucleoside triphosphate hydrolase [Helianthus anomalus]